MRFIISGSRGLIGEKLKQRLEKEKHKCILEIDQRCGSDIRYLNSYQITPKTQYTDIFFHLGAYCKINETVKDPKLAHYNNAEGTFQALEFCRRNNIKKFVYMSSSRTLSPEENPYTASKKYGEALCEAYKQCYNIDYLIIRPSTVYGDNHHDLTTRLITKWVINALKREPLIIYGDKNKTLDFTHVSDFVDGIMLLLKNWDKSKNQAYDICGSDQRKLMDVAEIIHNIVKYPIIVEYQNAEIAQPQNIKIDITKLRKFGYEPKIKLEEGLRRLVNFYKGEGDIWIKN